MIYGQFAKDYATSRATRGGANFKVVSESDAIIDCLINEASNYNNMLLNESFISDDERLVMEAKIEVLNEAVGAAIIAAIIAIVGALIALIAKFISMMREGGNKIRQTKSSPGSSSDDDKQKKEREEFEKQWKEERKAKAQAHYKDEYEKAIADFEKGFKDGSLSKFIVMKDGADYVLGLLMTKALAESEFGKPNDIGIQGISSVNITDAINENTFKRIFTEVQIMFKSFKENYSKDVAGAYQSISKKIVEDIEKDILPNIFNVGGRISLSLLNIDESSNTIRQNLVDYYNKSTTKNATMVDTAHKIIESKFDQLAVKKQEKMNYDLKALDKYLKNMQKNGDWIPKPEVRDKWSKTEDQAKSEFELKKQALDQTTDAMKSIRNTVQLCKSFMSDWAKIESYRLRAAQFINRTFWANYKLAAKQGAYLSAKRIYKDDFNMEAPISDYESLKKYDNLKSLD